MAEEVCHRVLEFNLWQTGQLPKGASNEELDPAQCAIIEKDARQLAAELLQPEGLFRQQYNHHFQLLRRTSKDNDFLRRSTVKAVATDFWVSWSSTAMRARHLGLVTVADYNRLFPPLF